MSNIQRFSGRPGRNLTVSGVKWKYVVGHSNVVAYSERGDRRCEYIWRAKGVCPSIFERGKWKKTSNGMLTPREVAKWLSSL